mgnify:CR=1 FL=1
MHDRGGKSAIAHTGHVPPKDNPRILPHRQLVRRRPAAGEQVAAAVPSNKGEPRRERNLVLLGDLELHGPLRLLLDDGPP